MTAPISSLKATFRERIRAALDYLGAEKCYYQPTGQGVEKKIKERLDKWRAEFSKSRTGCDGKPK
jgi:hypothetical protein